MDNDMTTCRLNGIKLRKDSTCGENPGRTCEKCKYTEEDSYEEDSYIEKLKLKCKFRNKWIPNSRWDQLSQKIPHITEEEARVELKQIEANIKSSLIYY